MLGPINKSPKGRGNLSTVSDEGMAAVVTRHILPPPHPTLFFFSSSSSSSSIFFLRLTTMASVRSLGFLPLVSNLPQQRLRSGIIVSSCSVHRSTPSSFNGQSLSLPRSHSHHSTTSPRWLKRGLIAMMVKPALQFIQGTDELTIPDVKLTRSRDGTNGVATFSFEQPSVFDSSGEVGEITGLYMIDEEGVIQSTDVNARFVNGKPAGIVARHVMRTPREWDRFMRFMERYSNENGLQFIKK